VQGGAAGIDSVWHHPDVLMRSQTALGSDQRHAASDLGLQQVRSYDSMLRALMLSCCMD